MPSLFPDLFTYDFLATGVLRISLGLTFLWFAYIKTFRKHAIYLEFFNKIKMRPAKVFLKIAILIELLAGLSITTGYYAQVALIVTGALMTIASFIKARHPHILPENTTAFYILLSVLSFAIIFIGPGAFAFDLPL